MKFEKTALCAIQFRANATGQPFMTVEEVANDLGGPVDFDEVLTKLHDRGLINLSVPFGTLTLTARGRDAGS